jgi:phage baseplate assembly protein W
MNEDKKAFLGQGWHFPIQTRDDGEVTMARHEEDIRQSIRIILGTNHGERVMRPEFGAGLQSMVFQPVNTTTMSLVRHRVEEALVRWEPRIDSITVTVTAESDQGRLLIDVAYRVRATNTFYNLVYPFYLMEGS